MTSYSENSVLPGEHYYKHTSELSCKEGLGNCTFKKLVSEIHKTGAYPSQKEPLDTSKDGYQFRELDSLIPGDIFTTDPIHTLPTDTGVVNVTTEDHLLHPGFVRRDVIRIDGNLHIQTEGGGWGAFGQLNNSKVPELWGGVNKLVFDEIKK